MKSIKTIEQYLTQVDRYLKNIPVSDKTDILSELKSSFYERLNEGQSEQAILSEMEDPKYVALSYLGDEIINKEKFSYGVLLKSFSFYTISIFSWISIIPSLAIISGTLILSSGLCLLGLVLSLLKGYLYLPVLDNIKMVYFGTELTGIPGF